VQLSGSHQLAPLLLGSGSLRVVVFNKLTFDCSFDEWVCDPIFRVP
jgi:hypothetical protein